MMEREMETVGDLLHEVLAGGGNNDIAESVRAKAARLCGPFPLYPLLQR
jgi:glycine/serine hydroxymethyltransferase